MFTVTRFLEKRLNIVQSLECSIFRDKHSMPNSKTKKTDKRTKEKLHFMLFLYETTTQGKDDDDGPVLSKPNETVLIKILAKPGSKCNAITDYQNEGVGVQIAAPPVDGEANIELVKYMAKVLGIGKNDIALAKGSRSRNKTLIINGLEKNLIISALKSQLKE